TIKFDGVSNGLASTINIPGYDSSSLTVFILAKGYNQTTGNSAGFLNVGNRFSGQCLIRNIATGSFSDYSHYNNTGGHLDAVGAAPNAGFPYKIFGVQKTLNVSLKLDTNGGPALLYNGSGMAGLYSSFTNGPYNVGFTSGDKTLNGEIPEIIAYTTALTDLQRHQVENYLYNKYSPPVDLGPDRVQNYSFCPVVLNPGTRFISYKWSNGSTADSITVTSSGIYSVTTVDVFNRTSSSTVRVTLQNPLTLNSTGASFCSGGSINLAPQMASFNNYTFLWSNGATASSINASTTGNYFVQVTDIYGCSRNSD